MNAETFKEVFIPYHAKLFRIAYRFVADASIAEDMLQETYIKLWNKRDELEKVENTEGFAIVILRNTCLDHIKRAKKDMYSDYDTEIPETSSLSHQVEVKDEIEKVQRLINKLPEQQREVMMLKHWDNKTDEEIEDITGLKAGNIRVLISRARKTIREQFAKVKQI